MKKSLILTTILTAAVAFSSCGDANANSGGSGITISGTQEVKDGKVYKNYIEENVCDGFCYDTEENVTGIFAAYMNGNGETWLLSPGDNYFSEFDPDGLCDIEAGKIYNITYDVQHTTGGEAGVRESKLLKVTSCEQADPSEMFAQTVDYLGISNEREVAPERYNISDFFASGQYGSRFVALDKGDGYIVYKEDGSVITFDTDKQVIIPFETAEVSDEAINIGFRVLCNNGVTDDRIIEAIKDGNIAENDDIFFLGSCSDRSDNIVNAAECAGISSASVKFFNSEFPPDEEFRMVITNEQFESGITAEELGISSDVFQAAKEEWEYGKYDPSLRFGVDGGSYSYDRCVLIIGGSFAEDSMPFMDDNARFCIANSRPYAADGSDSSANYNYAVLSVRQEYDDMFL
ncbi:MAG: hypothetical protein J6M17_04345 [Ruminococcus sp.]|nr:hypothetical protein [Ruminococcus sp.]